MFDIDLITYFNLGQTLCKQQGITLTEYNQMMVWHRDVHVELIKQRIEEQSNNNNQGQ